MATRRSFEIRKGAGGFEVLASPAAGREGKPEPISTTMLVSEEAARTWAWENLSVPMGKWARRPDGSLSCGG